MTVVVAGARAVDLDQRPLGVDLPVVAVALLDPLAELDALAQPFTCSMSRMVEKCAMPSDRMFAAGPSPGVEHVPPPLVRRLVRGDQNAAFAFGSLCVRKPIPSENVMLVGKPCA